MLRVMIVDDEYMLLRGLRKLIDWEAMGLTIVNTAQNPLLALDYLGKEPVDILLSDMNMPELAGPDFVAKAKALQPDMELIVISGYEDFDYVRAGLQQHAVNYLRKPIDTDELITTLEAAMKRIAARQESDYNASLAAQAELRDLVTGAGDEAALIDSLAVNFASMGTPVRLLAVMNPIPPKVLVKFLRVMPAVHGFFREGQDFFILFQGDAKELATFVQEAPLPVSSSRRPVLIGPPASRPAELREDYAQLTAEIARQYFFETAAGLRELTRPAQASQVLTLPGYSTVKDAIGDLEPAAFRHWLVQQMAAFAKANASVTFAKQFALVVLLVLGEQLPATEGKSTTIAAINQAQTVTKLITTLVDVAQRAALQERHQYSRNVLMMRELVRARYQEPLSLSTVAKELHLNAVYLGQQFKQETGRSFSQYLNDWRMGLAMDLLQNSEEDVNRIALAVGYQTPSYFYKLFKQQTGMSPREYRAAAGNAQD